MEWIFDLTHYDILSFMWFSSSVQPTYHQCFTSKEFNSEIQKPVAEKSKIISALQMVSLLQEMYFRKKCVCGMF